MLSRGGDVVSACGKGEASSGGDDVQSCKGEVDGEGNVCAGAARSRQILGGRARTLGIEALPVNIGNERILSGGARILRRPPPVEAEPIAARAESRIWMQALNEDESDEYDSNEDCTDTSGDADDACSDGENDTSENANDNQDAQLEGDYHDASDDDFTSDNDCASNGDYNSSNSSDDCASNGDYNRTV